jgi:N-glycosylase/DNA lyase
MQEQILLLPFQLSQSEISIIDTRLKEFSELGKLGNEEWFSELCFCLLTANSQAQRAIDIQKHLGIKGFLEDSEESIARTIKSFGHRFHNNKAKYIVLARKYKNIKDHLNGLTNIQAREFIVKNIKGLGYKEASHFLRNVGYKDFAIIDRHIIKFLYQNNFIKEILHSITKKLYLELEDLLKNYKIELNRLDLMIWYNITGKILK